MNKLIIVGALLLVLVGGFCVVYDEQNNIDVSKPNKNYAPSENLAIMEGRFDDARRSIERSIELSNG